MRMKMDQSGFYRKTVPLLLFPETSDEHWLLEQLLAVHLSKNSPQWNSVYVATAGSEDLYSITLPYPDVSPAASSAPKLPPRKPRSPRPGS